MALIEARKRLDVTGMDIAEQPGSKFILLYNDLPFAIDDLRVTEAGVALGYRAGGDDPVVAFHVEKAAWILVRRDAAKLATKEEIAEAQADILRLQEETMARLHPDEYRAYLEQRRRALGQPLGQPAGQYL